MAHVLAELIGVKLEDIKQMLKAGEYKATEKNIINEALHYGTKHYKNKIASREIEIEEFATKE